jgi:hypothetical protein
MIMQEEHPWSITAALLTLTLTACAPDLDETLGDGTSGDSGMEGGSTAQTADGASSGELPGEGGPQVQHEDEGGGVTRTTIDASSEAQWIYLDLESRQQLEVADPAQSDAWDLGLRRFEIAIDGGISGPGGMEAVVLEGVAFADVTEVPGEGWVSDAADGDDENEDADLALAGWYDYDFMAHVLTPRPVVYVVRTVEGNVFKLEILDYYDDAGTGGVLTIRWAAVDAG